MKTSFLKTVNERMVELISTLQWCFTTLFQETEYPFNETINNADYLGLKKTDSLANYLRVRMSRNLY